MSDNKNSNRNKNQKNNQRPRQTQQSSADNSLSSTVKGIIAIMLTLLVVIIVIMIFAKSLFVNDNTTPKKTGTITSTEYIPPETTTTYEVVTEAEKSTSDKKDEEYTDPYRQETDESDYVEITCVSAVYLHPQPTSSSENLLTIPSGAVCKFFRDENGWYYVEYNGTQGYAWNSFFSAPPTT